MKFIGMIPARLESVRLPKKLLKDICGIPLIVHVYERCKLSKTLDEVYVATDSTEIQKIIEDVGGKVILTSKDHKTGTDRLAEAAQKVNGDIIVNIQGDEALLNPSHIDLLISEFPKSMDDCPVGILVIPYKKFNSPSDIKVVLNKNNEVMYLSRNDLPSNSRSEVTTMLKAYHIVPFRKNFLIQYAAMKQTELEKIEHNEYLRILENGYKIKAFKVESNCISIDTQSDLEYVIDQMPSDDCFQQYRHKYSV